MKYAIIAAQITIPEKYLTNIIYAKLIYYIYIIPNKESNKKAYQYHSPCRNQIIHPS